MARSLHKVKEEPEVKVLPGMMEVPEAELDEKALAAAPIIEKEPEVEPEVERTAGFYEQKPLMDLIYVYLQEMDERDLFTPNEEVERAREVQILRDELWGRILGFKFVDPSPYPEFSDLLISETVAQLGAWLDDLKHHRKSEHMVRKESGLTRKRLQKNYRELVTLKAKLEERRNVFVEANLRLVVKIANRYRNQAVNIADLIQEGNLGLIRAVESSAHSRKRAS